MEAPGPPRLFRVYSFRPTAWEHEVLEDFPAFLINLLGVVEIRYELDVAFGSFASVWPRTADFRSTPVNGHRQVGSAGPFRARRRHRQASGRSLLYP